MVSDLQNRRSFAPIRLMSQEFDRWMSRSNLPFRLSRRVVGMPLLLLAMVLLLTAYVPNVMPQSVITQKVEPQLLAFAIQHPADRVAVIIRKTAQARHIERAVAEVGGEVTNDLPIINAFAARLPGCAILQLATNPAVCWIALDGPVESGKQRVGTPAVPTVNTDLASACGSASVGA